MLADYDLSDSFLSKLDISSVESKVQENAKFISEGISLRSLKDFPECILNAYEKRHIHKLFPWQMECLHIKDVLNGKRNLLYSAPTSAGKTLVSELLTFRKLVQRVGSKAFFIVPFVSMANEKFNYFTNLLSMTGIRTGQFFGGSNANLSHFDLAVCTIEKANIMLNTLIHDKKLKETLAVVVIDEIHMIMDASRGSILQMIVTKLKVNAPEIQIIAMSATVPEIDSVAKWLDAVVYTTSFRPVPLRELYKFGTSLYELKTFKFVQEIDVSNTVADDDVWPLVRPLFSDNNGVLIFCCTKAWCERLALTLCQHIEKVESTEIENIINSLKRSQSGLDVNLAKTLHYRVGFHHAGLSLQEREAVEGAFRRGSILILTATNTLCSGVNLPARRVIIRSLKFGGGGARIDPILYKQMSGRAGRTGVDVQGDSVVMCADECDVNFIREITQQNCQCLVYQKSFLDSTLQRVILESIHIDGSSKTAIQSYVSFFLNTFDMTAFEKALQWLIEKQFLVLHDDLYVFTQLGKACVKAGISPDEALLIYEELKSNIKNGIILDSDVHLLYLISPLLPITDWLKYMNIFSELPESIVRIASSIGIQESFIVSRVRSAGSSRSDCKYQRFHSALILHYIINEHSIDKVSMYFGTSKGQVQTLQHNAATRSHCIANFALNLNWHNIHALLFSLSQRIEFGVRPELCELVRIQFLSSNYARMLYNNGYCNLASLAHADVNVLARIFREQLPFGSTICIGRNILTENELAFKIVHTARKIVSDDCNFNMSDLPFQNNKLVAESEKSEEVNETTTFDNETKISFVDTGLETDDGSSINVSSDDPFELKDFWESVLLKNDIQLTEIIPDDQDIVALHRVNDHLYAFTQEQTKLCLSTSFPQRFSFLLTYNFLPDFDGPDKPVIDIVLFDWFVMCREKYDTSNEAFVCRTVFGNFIPYPVLYPSYLLKTFHTLRSKISESAFEYFTNVEMLAFRSLKNMVRNGFLISSSKLADCHSLMRNRIEMLENEAWKLAGHKFSLASSKEVSIVLFSEQKLQPRYLKTRGKAQTFLPTNSSSISHLMANRLGQIICDWRRLKWDFQNVIENLVQHTAQRDGGRIHADFNIPSTTGRYTLTNPPLQMIPKQFKLLTDESTIINLRSLFIASNGFSLLSADFCRLELCILANISKEPYLCAVMTEQNAFNKIATDLGLNDLNEKQAKNLVYGILYGMGAETLSQQMDISLESAHSVTSTFFKLIPNVNRLIKEISAEAEKHNYIETLRKRQCKVNAKTMKSSYKLLNHLIQSSASEIVKEAIVRVQKHEFPYTVKLIHFVHDELIFEIQDENLNDAIRTIRVLLESSEGLMCSFKVKLSCGKDWGSLKPVSNGHVSSS